MIFKKIELDTKDEKIYNSESECLVAITKLINSCYDYDLYEDEVYYNDLKDSYQSWINKIINTKIKELNNGRTEIGVDIFLKVN